jgi:hypothetical protein
LGAGIPDRRAVYDGLAREDAGVLEVIWREVAVHSGVAADGKESRAQEEGSAQEESGCQEGRAQEERRQEDQEEDNQEEEEVATEAESRFVGLISARPPGQAAVYPGGFVSLRPAVGFGVRR